MLAIIIIFIFIDCCHYLRDFLSHYARLLAIITPLYALTAMPLLYFLITRGLAAAIIILPYADYAIDFHYCHYILFQIITTPCHADASLTFSGCRRR